MTLQESTIKSIEDTVNASYERKRKSAPLIPNDLRADIFPATGLRIGEYKVSYDTECRNNLGFIKNNTQFFMFKIKFHA